MVGSASTLHMLCGKIASGKSTLSAQLARREGGVVISEDAWLAALFREEMSTPADYLRFAEKLQAIMGPHVAALLNAGVSVVLDFPANTVEARNWMRGILAQTEASHVLHVLDVPDDVCVARLRARNAQGEHPFAATEEQFVRISRHFVAPSPDEGFNIELHAGDMSG